MVYKPKKGSAKPKPKHAVMKYYYKINIITGKRERVTRSGKPWKPYKSNPKPLPMRRKKLDLEKAAKKLKGGKK